MSFDYLKYPLGFLEIPHGAKEEDFCEVEMFRDIRWPKLFKGGTAVKRCPNGTVGLYLYLIFCFADSSVLLQLDHVIREYNNLQIR